MSRARRAALAAADEDTIDPYAAADHPPEAMHDRHLGVAPVGAPAVGACVSGTPYGAAMDPSLPKSLPPGGIVESYGRSGRLVWMSDGEVPDADTWWSRLYAERTRTGLYPVLLEYPEDMSAYKVGGDGPVDAAAYLSARWRPDAWPGFPRWPGLAAPAPAGADPDACAAEAATSVVDEGRATCLALVRAERGSDVPVALNWPGMTNRMTTADLSGVLRSWEDRFAARLVGLGHGDLFLSAAIPPSDLHQAHVLAAEHYLTCPDVFHHSFDDWENTYPAELLTLRQWHFWWD
ncbi:DUF4253 domain-containing protein [Streptomyces sp. T028]|uniref:DUF4253 domain-containing protein n=1 Tax=Streptomyces sp. T028 TaxID=3394379 RepID=UPI003A85D151